MARLIACAALASCLAACQQRASPRPQVEDAKPTVTESSASAVPVASALPVAAPASSTVEAESAYAVFKGDNLDECTDMAISAPVSHGEAKVKEAVSLMRKKLAPKDAVLLKSSCAEQFKDRFVLGSCRNEQASVVDGGALALLILSNYYSAATVSDSDKHMRACLQDEGKWTAAAKDDPAAARERLRQRAKSMQDIADKAKNLRPED